VRRLATGYELDDDRLRLDVDAICRFLLNEAYWHRWRRREDIEQQLCRSWRCVGLYSAADQQVGFARAVSDGVALGYLADLYVLSGHRGRGLGLALARELVEAPATHGMRWMLHTADAHDLYRKLGFGPAPGTLMERPAAMRAATPPSTSPVTET